MCIYKRHDGYVVVISCVFSSLRVGWVPDFTPLSINFRGGADAEINIFYSSSYSLKCSNTAKTHIDRFIFHQGKSP